MFEEIFMIPLCFFVGMIGGIIGALMTTWYLEND
jgi:hypothetical protein